MGANPTQDRPPAMVLLFSDVSECAPDSRGRSHVGHALDAQVCFFCPLYPLAFLEREASLGVVFIFREESRILSADLICVSGSYFPISKGGLENATAI